MLLLGFMSEGEPAATSPVMRGVEPRVATRCPRILVAEDNDDLRKLVVETLQDDGCDVVDVADGQQLLIRLTSQYRLRPEPEPIDLLLTDVCMPIVSGMDIVRSLREAGWTTPIVVITASADPQTRAIVSRLGVDLLDKPFKLEALRSRVRTLLSAPVGRGPGR